MVIVKLNNGSIIEASNVKETYSIKTSVEAQLAINIEEGMQDLGYYNSLLSEEGALDHIEVSVEDAIASFDGFTEIRNLDKTISESGVKVRINLTKPTIE